MTKKQNKQKGSTTVETATVLQPLREHYRRVFERDDKSVIQGRRSRVAILNGDALATLKTLPDNSVHCCVTSPPYFHLRDYEIDGQIGHENTVEEYAAGLAAVFGEVRRVLHPSGTLWLNLGDSYAKKELRLVPASVAFALKEDGWHLRSDIVWHKTAPMPESVTDRPTGAWEHIYLLSKNGRYFYDGEAVKTQKAGADEDRGADAVDLHTFSRRSNLRNVWRLGPEPYRGGHFAPFPTAIPRTAILAGTSEKGCCPVCFNPWERITEKRRLSGVYGGLRKRADAKGRETSESSIFRTGDAIETRSIGWKPTCDCGEPEIIPCVVLDVFGGSGTTGKVALELGRNAILIELNSEYCELARERCVGALAKMKTVEEVPQGEVDKTTSNGDESGPDLYDLFRSPDVIDQ